MTDPTPFLSTIITASAGLVAIIGGLLVARFVSLDSDQRTSRKIIGEARDRLDSARQRARDAHDTRLDWHARLFFRGLVLSAVGEGFSDPAELMRLDDDWPFTMQELKQYATEMAGEFVQGGPPGRSRRRHGALAFAPAGAPATAAPTPGGWREKHETGPLDLQQGFICAGGHPCSRRRNCPGPGRTVKAVCDRRATASINLSGECTREDGLD